MPDGKRVVRRSSELVLAGLLALSVAPAQAQPGSLQGKWIMDDRGDWRGLALTAVAQDTVDTFDRSVGDPSMRCVPPGLIRTAENRAPFEIIEQDHQIVILYESFNVIRRIYIDGRTAPDWLPSSPFGFSVGVWEGDTLVVETTRLAPHLFNDDGTPFSGGPGTRVLERYRASGESMEAEFTVEDPVNLAATATRTLTYDRTPDQPMIHFHCDPLDATGWRLPATGDSLRDLLQWLDLRPPIPERE
jgi:hypothetical protein